MSPTVGAALINWSDLWRIVLAALVGGSGVVIVFGLVLIGISRGKRAGRPITRYGLYTLSGVCAALLVVVAAVGVYAMTQKRSSGKSKPRTASTTLAPAGTKPREAAGTVSIVASG
jgi:uncharacterized membrane protein